LEILFFETILLESHEFVAIALTFVIFFRLFKF
jgi:hypothetical protein